ncbi:cytochrome P450 71D11-like [Cornus florida]|uniref:cytochrome P450 71D11-like n=1 Tax=Cornus florida TaxID=4283 RepID=UPI00289EE55C|nr:cytochrome P450 71D11-like [Cornus florida]
MEATFNRKHSSICRISTPSPPKRFGDEIWTSDAPATQTTSYCCDYFSRICQRELLSAKRVQSFRPIREEEALNLIKSISTHIAGSLINLTEKLFSMTYNVVSKVVIGKKFHGKEEFLSLIRDTMEVAGGFNVADLFPSVKILGWISGLRPRAKNIHRKIDEIFTNIIDEHKARDGKVDCEDLIDVLLKVQEKGNLNIPLTMTKLKSVLMDIFTGGIETSSSTVIFGKCQNC